MCALLDGLDSAVTALEFGAELFVRNSAREQHDQLDGVLIAAFHARQVRDDFRITLGVVAEALDRVVDGGEVERGTEPIEQETFANTGTKPVLLVFGQDGKDFRLDVVLVERIADLGLRFHADRANGSDVLVDARVLSGRLRIIECKEPLESLD